MAERYDVIIIGSGAGGGTLAHRLAPSGKKILILERGDWLPREARNWSVEDVFGVNRYVSPETWLTVRRQRRSSRRFTISSAAPPRCSARRSIACARRISASCAITTASRPPGRSATTRWSPITPRPSISIRCMGSTASTRPIRRRAPPTLGRPSRTSRASQKLADDLAAAGYHPFHAPSAVMMNEADMAYSRMHPLPDLRRLSLPGSREVRRRGDRGSPGDRTAERHAAAQRARAAARDQRGGHGGRRRRRRSRRNAASVSRPTSSSSPAARPIRPRCCCARPTTAIRTASPTARVRSDATTCSTTARRCWRCR